MARRISVELIGEYASLERAFLNGGNAAKVFAQTTVKANATVAEARIAASAKQIASLRADQATFAAASASYVKGSDEQIAASKLLIDTQHRLQVAMGETAAFTGRVGGSAGKAEREVGRFTRGALAGSGAIRGLGRSLAFASGGFLAFAGGAAFLRDSIKGAESLEKAQKGLAVAIEHTGGNVAKLTPKYEATAKAAQQFGINQADALTGLKRATVLTGDAVKAQRAYQEALVISKATGKDFNAVLTATSKGQEGVTTSLQRYGILIAKGTPSAKQYQQVFARFGGQAKANTSGIDRFNATLQNTEEIVGTALLPVLNKYLDELGAWLQKMDRSGQLQRDVNKVVRDGVVFFKAAGAVIHTVDRATGSFVNTLKVLAAFKFASLVTGWIGSLKTLATEWGLVKTAAIEANAAEGAGFLGGGGRGGAGPGVLPFNLAKKPSVVDRVGGYTAEGAAAAAAASKTAFAARTGVAKYLAPEALFTLGDQGEVGTATTKVVNGWQFVSFDRGKHWIREWYVGFAAAITPQLQNFARTGQAVPKQFQAPGFGLAAPGTPSAKPPTVQGPFGSAQPIQIWKNFQLRIADQIAQAQASLTQGTQDDVAVAKAVVAHIKQTIAKGHLQGAALIQALGQEASALSTIWSAEAAAAQKRAQAAAAAQARIQQQIENSIDPIKLEVGLSRAEALGKPLIPYLKALRAAAKQALASGKLSLAQQKEAYDQITSLNQQIAQAIQTGVKSFTEPLKFQIALAREQAFGQDTTKTLLKMKAAALKAIRSGKYTGQALLDLYNQVTSLNQQLGDSAKSGLSQFKELNTRKLTAGLNLTPQQRAALRARLSQIGPGNTVPGPGVGAYGYAINPKTDQPIHVHTRIDVDGTKMAENTTRHQQKKRRRNSSQTRGPNAGQAFGF